MYTFPKNLYTDVRIEKVFETSIKHENNIIKENKTREYTGAFIRIFDGDRWYSKSTSNVEDIQKEIIELSNMAIENREIYSNPIVKKIEVNVDSLYSYNGIEIDKVSKYHKEALVKEIAEEFKNKTELKSCSIIYNDKRVEKEFYSSKGSKLSFDYQDASVFVIYGININNKVDSQSSLKSSYNFSDLYNAKESFKIDYEKSLYYLKNEKPIIPGKYTVVMSPSVAGVFAHESFGHKSESDCMLGDESLLKEWVIGSKVGSKELSIYDCGNIKSTGYCPYDDEGNKCKKTYLIKNGILKGRLHSAETASYFNEEITGNCRAKNFEFEPIVRMTSTVIEGGEMTFDELIEPIKEGVLLDYWKYGTGLSTFTIAPSRAYMIRNGKIAEPVSVSVATGNVMETLFNVDGISKEVELCFGKCGKDDQGSLPVTMGAPYIRIQNLQLQ